MRELSFDYIASLPDGSLEVHKVVGRNPQFTGRTITVHVLSDSGASWVTRGEAIGYDITRITNMKASN